jgi:hypothetical protein
MRRTMDATRGSQVVRLNPLICCEQNAHATKLNQASPPIGETIPRHPGLARLLLGFYAEIKSVGPESPEGQQVFARRQLLRGSNAERCV